MRSISFSSMEGVITVQEPSGTYVSYRIFEESEIHPNRITPGNVQEWHYHTRIDECLLITKGVLTRRWLGDGAERARKVREQGIACMGSSVRTFANESEEDVEFVVFRFVPDGRDRRETIKSDKVVVDR